MLLVYITHITFYSYSGLVDLYCKVSYNITVLVSVCISSFGIIGCIDH